MPGGGDLPGGWEVQGEGWEDEGMGEMNVLMAGMTGINEQGDCTGCA